MERGREREREGEREREREKEREGERFRRFPTGEHTSLAWVGSLIIGPHATRNVGSRIFWPNGVSEI